MGQIGTFMSAQQAIATLLLARVTGSWSGAKKNEHEIDARTYEICRTRPPALPESVQGHQHVISVILDLTPSTANYLASSGYTVSASGTTASQLRPMSDHSHESLPISLDPSVLLPANKSLNRQLNIA